MLYNYLEYCISITKVKNNRKPIQTGYGCIQNSMFRCQRNIFCQSLGKCLYMQMPDALRGSLPVLSQNIMQGDDFSEVPWGCVCSHSRSVAHDFSNDYFYFTN